MKTIIRQVITTVVLVAGTVSTGFSQNVKYCDKKYEYVNNNQARPTKGINTSFQYLNHQYAEKLKSVIKIMKEKHGYDMVIVEGYSPERQTVLFEKVEKVTQSKSLQSYHQYGLAADCAFLKNGRMVMSETDPWVMKGYKLFGQLAEAEGLTWGGKWTFKDYGHTELRVPTILKKYSVNYPKTKNSLISMINEITSNKI